MILLSRTLILITAASTLAGCVRSMEHVAALPITAEGHTSQSAAEVRDCLVMVMDKARARPIQTGAPESMTLAFTGDTGTIALYELHAIEGGGTHVVARRRQMIADRFEEARTCYPS